MTSYPVLRAQPHEVWFGNVSDGKFRGSEELIANPPFSHIDNYFWLRDDSRTNQEIVQIINQENTYTNSILKPHYDLQKQIFQELKGYMKEDYSTYPTAEHSVKSPFKYSKEFKSGSGYYKYQQLDTRVNQTRTLLDINELAKGKPQCDVISLTCSLDEKYFSYCVDFDGSEKYKLVIQNIETETYIDTSPIPLISYGEYEWVSNTRIVYTQFDDSNKPYQIWTWDIKSSKPPLLIYEECIQDLSLEFYISEDNKYIFINSSDYDSTSVLFGLIEFLGQDQFVLTRITDRIKSLKYSISHSNGYFYIKNNLNAVNWKVSKVYVDQVQDLNQWIDLVPANKNVYVKSFGITKFFGFVGLKINGGTYLGFIGLDGPGLIYITNFIDHSETFLLAKYNEVKWRELWPKSVYTLGIYSYLWDDKNICVSIDKMTHPYALFNFDISTKTLTQVYMKDVPGYDGTLYESKRIYTQTSDGKAVPLSLIYKKGTIFPAPTYLYGYGSYGHTVEPNFDYQILPLLNRGWIYAIAHVRGGSFLGYDWYLQGKGMTKMNTFTDFIASAERLINSGYAKSKEITCDGRSAGGLLVGASMVLRPELFKNVIMGVPFLDVLNTMSDSTIPLTVEEWTQWGNPNIKSDYDYMVKYCPYTNLKAGVEYPNIFVTGGLHDPRVQYWEPLKFISKLRALKSKTNSSTSIQCLKIEMEQGHFGGSDRYKNLKETAEQYTFVLSR
jgi:oligopeptidase B